jgi:hypothetical protein
MHKLMEYICDELEELERKAEKDGKLSMADVQYMDTLAHAKKNLLKSDEMMEDGEYSNRSYARGREYSYARGRRGNVRRDSMGRYSREGMGMSYNRDGYSMAEDDFRSELEELMHDAPNDQIKMKIQRIMSEM